MNIMTRRRCLFACLICLTSFAMYEVLSEKTFTISTSFDESATCGGEGLKPCLDDLSTDILSDEWQSSSKNRAAEPQHSSGNVAAEPINVIITFTNARDNRNLQGKFGVTVRSLFQYSSLHIKLHLIGDSDSRKIAEKILMENVPDSTMYTLGALDVDVLGKDLEEIIRPMQERFSFKPGSYYNHVLFFLSVALHRVLPQEIQRVIMLDADLKFTDDIAKLYSYFDSFTADNVIGIARDAQPVYRHTFWQYRRDHPGTRVGEPPPNGLTGFNSGVLLLDLNKMRSSELYNTLLAGDSVNRLSAEFGFKGHLGDQDFFTLIGMRYESLFYVLPCQWNRQLCVWWKNGYAEVFELYHRCDGDIKIYHGNCNTPIP